MTDEYLAKPIVPQAKEKELNLKFRKGVLYTAGEVITCIHNYLPYRVPLKELGISEERTQHDDPNGPPGNARFERTERLREFLTNITPDLMTDVGKGHKRYEHNKAGTWAIIVGWVYLRDPKLIAILKLAFG